MKFQKARESLLMSLVQVFRSEFKEAIAKCEVAYQDTALYESSGHANPVVHTVGGGYSRGLYGMVGDWRSRRDTWRATAKPATRVQAPVPNFLGGPKAQERHTRDPRRRA